MDEYEAHIQGRTCPAGVCQMDEAPVAELVELLRERAPVASNGIQVMEEAD
jgi:hypothetical protein